MAISEYSQPKVDEAGQPRSHTSTCPECDGRVTTNTVETVCEECGLVIDEQRIDHGPEWRAFETDERRRTGSPLTAARHDRGLSTEIGYGADANGHTLSTQKKRRLSRMRREQMRGKFQSKADRNLAHGLGEIRRIVSALELPETIRDQACQLFRSGQNEGLLPGRSIESMAAASVYGACRCNGHSRTLDDIVSPARVEQSRVTNAYKVLNTELGLPTEPMRPSAFVPRQASELEVSDHIRKRARQLATEAESAGLTTGVRPSGFAAACLYKADQEYKQSLTQTTVADIANVTPVTVRTHWKTLQKHEVDAD